MCEKNDWQRPYEKASADAGTYNLPLSQIKSLVFMNAAVSDYLSSGLGGRVPFAQAWCRATKCLS